MTTTPSNDFPDEAQRREAWLADRRTAITASDVGAIFGVSPFASPMDVYLDKKGLSERVETERMRWGLKLQRAILEEYADRVGRPIAFDDPYRLQRHPKHAFLGASLDAHCTDGDRRPVDAKNVGFKTREWGESGTGEIPYSYALQLHVQMMVTGAPSADLAVLFGGNTLAIYTVHADPEIETMIVDAAREFWDKHVEAGFPPAVDGSEGWREFLQKHVRMHQKSIRPATDEEVGWIVDLLEKREKGSALDREISELENRIKSAIGVEQGIDSGVAKITWAQTADSLFLDKDGLISDLCSILHQVVPETAQGLIEKCREAHTMPKAGTRRFLVKAK